MSMTHRKDRRVQWIFDDPSHDSVNSSSLEPSTACQ